MVARSQALVRSAYLLVRDEGLAEDLVRTALAKAWFAWRRIDDPEAYVRRIMVTTSTSWWRRRAGPCFFSHVDGTPLPPR